MCTVCLHVWFGLLLFYYVVCSIHAHIHMHARAHTRAYIILLLIYFSQTLVTWVMHFGMGLTWLASIIVTMPARSTISFRWYISTYLAPPNRKWFSMFLPCSTLDLYPHWPLQIRIAIRWLSLALLLEQL